PHALDGAGHRQVRGLRLARPPLLRTRPARPRPAPHGAAGQRGPAPPRARRRHDPRQGCRLPRGEGEAALHAGLRGGVGGSPPHAAGGGRTMNSSTPAPALRSGAMSVDLAKEGQRAVAAPLGQALLELARADERVVGLSADLAKYTDLHILRDAMPERFYQIGMAEQALLGAATGLAMEGFIPFASTYSVFATRRAYDFLMLDIAEANLNVNMVCALPGLTTGYGPSHQATEDVSILRGMPNLTI